MASTLLQIALRLAVCAAITYPMWRVFGSFGLLFAAPLFGIALARPLIDLASETRRLLRAQALRQVEGRHYAYKGSPIKVLEDADLQRWLHTPALRRIVPGLPVDRQLLGQFPTACQRFKGEAGCFIRDDALRELLSRSSDAQAPRLKVWVEREVAFPAEQQRQRHGHRHRRPAD